MTSFIVQAPRVTSLRGLWLTFALCGGAVLFVITLLLNILSQQIVKRFGEKYE
ncbi:MAG: hypothetical protein R2865_17440 [Deinococcales bacterium]